MNAVAMPSLSTGRRWFSLGTPLLAIALLGMLVLPMPPVLLDLFFTFNIALSLVVLLMAVYTRRPLDFSIFPSVLLIATLLRLALNVASTRVVLLDGHSGTDAAGHVIESFGEFVIGGNYAVGLAVFSATVAGVVPALRMTSRSVHRNIQHARSRSSGVRFGGLSSALIVADVAAASGTAAASPAGDTPSAPRTAPRSRCARAAASRARGRSGRRT